MKVQYKTIKISQISLGNRTREDYGDYQDLAGSMKDLAVLSSFAVMEQDDKDKPYLLLAGGRRLRAAEMAGIKEVPAVIFEDKLSDAERKNVELAENIHRKDLEWDERIKLMQEIHNLQVSIHGEKTSGGPNVPGWSARDTARLLNVSHGTVARDLNLANALEQLPELRASKSKDDAERVLKKTVRALVIQETAEKIEQETSTESKIDILRKKLCKLYILAPEKDDPLESGFFAYADHLQTGTFKYVSLDPPYAIGDEEQQEIMARTSAVDPGKTWMSQDLYVPMLKKALAESHRMLKDDGWLVVWFGPEPWFETTYQLIIEAGFEVRRTVGIWCKQKGFSFSPDTCLSNAYEMFYYAHKGKPKLLESHLNTFHHSTVPHSVRVHPTEKPIELEQELITLFCKEGDLIAVPFLGSGNMILAAANLDITACGYDIVKSYKDSFTVKVYETQPPHYRTFKSV